MKIYKVRMSVLILAVLLCLPPAVFSYDLSGYFGIYHTFALATGSKERINGMEQMEPLYFKAYKILKGKHDPNHKTWEDQWEFGKGIGAIAMANAVKPAIGPFRQSKVDELLEECVPVMQPAMAKIREMVK